MKRLLLAQFVVIVILGGLATYLSSQLRVARNTPVQESKVIEQAQKAERPLIKTTKTSQTKLVPQDQRKGDTPWSTIATSDYAKFAQNLRDLGCPEETVELVITDAIKRSYEKELNQFSVKYTPKNGYGHKVGAEEAKKLYYDVKSIREQCDETASKVLGKTKKNLLDWPPLWVTKTTPPEVLINGVPQPRSEEVSYFIYAAEPGPFIPFEGQLP